MTPPGDADFELFVGPPGVERVWRADVPAANPVGVNQHSGSRATRATQQADTADAITSRLKRDDPALAEQVVRRASGPRTSRTRPTHRMDSFSAELCNPEFWIMELRSHRPFWQDSRDCRTGVAWG